MVVHREDSIKQNNESKKEAEEKDKKIVELENLLQKLTSAIERGLEYE